MATVSAATSPRETAFSLDSISSISWPEPTRRLLDSHVSEGKRQAILDKLSRGSPDILAGTKVVRLDTTDGFRFLLADESWLLVRFSGTEPLVRLYAEAESTERLGELLNEGKRLIAT